MTTYAVTGATGGLGGSAVRGLLEHGIAPGKVVAVVRNPDKAATLREAGVDVRVADYTDVDALTAALTGVDRLLMISGSEVGQRIAQHINIIDAAKRAGVGLIAYTSILRADTTPVALAAEHVETEKLLADSGIPTVLLRNGWYWENYLPGAAAAIDSGVLYGSAGDGKVAGAARADYGQAGAAALVNTAGGEIYELAGSERLTPSDIAAAYAEVSGKPVRYQDVSEADYAAALVGSGIPEPFAKILADTDARTAEGALDSDSSDLTELLGRPATTLVDVLRAGL